MDTQQLIKDVCQEISDFLVGKNQAYGNSALEPMRVFSTASTEEQLFVRIDDKLSRIMRGKEYPGDDTIDDLVGYLILLKVYKRMVNDSNEERGYQEIASQKASEENGEESARQAHAEEALEESHAQANYFPVSQEDAERIAEASRARTATRERRRRLYT